MEAGETTPRRNNVLATPSAEDLRAALERMVVNDLLGPAGGPGEVIETRPRERYLVGMLAPHGARTAPEEEERVEVEEVTDTQEGQSDDNVPAAPTLLPSSIGVSFCVGPDTHRLQVTARWGRYLREKPKRGKATRTGRGIGHRSRGWWRSISARTGRLARSWWWRRSRRSWSAGWPAGWRTISW
jgi:hypothetical protein